MANYMNQGGRRSTQSTNDEHVVNKIRHLFVTYVDPHTVLDVFHSVDINVLTASDIERVRAVMNANGRRAGAGKLLDILPKYPNWFSCLKAVLRHSDVKMSHVAKQMMAKIGDAPRQQEGQTTQVKQLESEQKLKEKNRKLKQDNARLQQLIAQLSEEKTKNESETNRLMATVNTLTQEKGQLLEEQAKYKSDVETLTTTVECLNKEKAQLTEEKAKFQSQANTLTVTVEMLQQEKDEKEKQLVDVRAALKTMTAKCEHYKIPHEKMKCLHCLLMRQENESIVLLNWYIKKNMSTDHPDVARKYLISREEIEPTLQAMISALELFEKEIDTDYMKREVSEESITGSKDQVVEYVKYIQERMKQWRYHDRNEWNWFYLKYAVTRLFYCCYHVIQHHSLSEESQSVANMMDFLTYSQDLMTKKIHPMMTSEGGWSEVMKITDYDRDMVVFREMRRKEREEREKEKLRKASGKK